MENKAKLCVRCSRALTGRQRRYCTSCRTIVVKEQARCQAAARRRDRAAAYAIHGRKKRRPCMKCGQMFDSPDAVRRHICDECLELNNEMGKLASAAHVVKIARGIPRWRDQWNWSLIGEDD